MSACGDLEPEGTPDLGGPDDPIVAEPGTWQWVDFPDSRCADGSPSGIGVNLSPGATQAVISFQGGGACWTYETCFGVPIAFNLGGFDRDDFEGLLTDAFLNQALFDRDEARNPLANAHHVFVPYCTGDAFLGHQINRLSGVFGLFEEDIYFHGAANVREFLRRLVPTFGDVEQVVLTGSSAGGFGAAFNWWTVKEFFPAARVDVIDDSGPPIQPTEGRWEEWQDAWGVIFPEGCVDCDLRVGALIEHAQRTVAEQGRFGLISYRSDLVISAFMGLSPWDFESRLNAWVDSMSDDPNINAFLTGGVLHTFLVSGIDGTESDGVELWDWLTQMLTDDPAWRTAR